MLNGRIVSDSGGSVGISGDVEDARETGETGEALRVGVSSSSSCCTSSAIVTRKLSWLRSVERSGQRMSAWRAIAGEAYR